MSFSLPAHGRPISVSTAWESLFSAFLHGLLREILGFEKWIGSFPRLVALVAQICMIQSSIVKHRFRPTTSNLRRTHAIWLLAGIMALNSCTTGQIGNRRPQATARSDDHHCETAASPIHQAMASTSPEFFFTGPTIKKKMLDLIEGASEYILIDSFITRTDPASLEVMEALKRKHDAGVKVYVIADSSSRFMKAGELGYDYMDRAGIPNAEYNPIRPHRFIFLPVMLQRDHRKFWIIDGRELFAGGANIFSPSLLPHEEAGNLDYMVAVQSAGAVAQMVESFVATWIESSRQKLRVENFPVRAPDDATVEIGVVNQSRTLGNSKIIGDMFENFFSLAEKEVWLIHAYTFTNKTNLRQIKELTARGVEVNLMLSAMNHAPRYTKGSFYGIKDILEAGAKVWLYDSGTGALHSKAVIVDGRWISLGSANFNRRSCSFSEELNVLLGDSESMEKVMRNLEGLKKHCRQVEMEEAKRYRSPRYYFEWIKMQVFG
jgi:cardiolipin synthase